MPPWDMDFPAFWLVLEDLGVPQVAAPGSNPKQRVLQINGPRFQVPTVKGHVILYLREICWGVGCTTSLEHRSSDRPDRGHVPLSPLRFTRLEDLGPTPKTLTLSLNVPPWHSPVWRKSKPTKTSFQWHSPLWHRSKPMKTYEDSIPDYGASESSDAETQTETEYELATFSLHASCEL